MKTRLQQKASGGFTLIESLFAAMLIGLVIAALAVSSGAFTMTNAAALDLSTAEFLIEEIREGTAVMPFDQLATAAGTYTTPIDMDGNLLTDFAVFDQQVTVTPCGNEFSAAADEDLVRITVTILKNAAPVSQTDWIRADVD